MIGRKGSTGFPGKNTYPVLGRPLCHYPMLAATHSRYIDRVYISTDDPAIEDCCRPFDPVFIERPAHLATKAALGEDAYVHALSTMKEQGVAPDILVLLMCNAATIDAATIDAGIEALQNDPSLDSAVTVSCYNMWSPLRARRESADGTLEPFVPFETFGDPATLNCDRDSQGDVWFADMGVSVIRAANLDTMENGLLPQKWMGQRIHPLKQWGGCDIDYEWQLPGVEFWLEKHGFTTEATPYDALQSR